MKSFRSITFATLTKDIRLEWRSKDALNAMLFFSLLVVVIFSFSFDPNAEESRQVAGGLVWVAFLFSAVVALNQTWARELHNQVLDAYRVSPAPANSLFIAKVLGNFLLVSLLEALMAPLFTIFYNLRVLGSGWQLIPVAVLGTWALVVNGTFFGAVSLRTPTREMTLPFFLFPLSIPPRSCGGAAPGLCTVPGAGGRPHGADHGGRATNLLLPRAFGLDRFSALL